MIYQVRANLYFDKWDEAVDFCYDCQVALPKSIVVNPHSVNQEPSTISLIENHHDENPNGPCSVLQYADNSTPPPQ